jgi:hypothetical protein
MRALLLSTALLNGTNLCNLWISFLVVDPVRSNRTSTKRGPLIATDY